MPHLRPPSGNMKLTLFSQPSKAGWRGVVYDLLAVQGAVVEVESAQEASLTASIVSRARTRERADEAGGEHPQQDYFMFKSLPLLA